MTLLPSPLRNLKQSAENFHILLSQICMSTSIICIYYAFLLLWTLHTHNESHVPQFSPSQGCDISTFSTTSSAFLMLLDHSIQRTDMLLLYQSLKTTTTNNNQIRNHHQTFIPLAARNCPIFLRSQQHNASEVLSIFTGLNSSSSFPLQWDFCPTSPPKLLLSCQQWPQHCQI